VLALLTGAAAVAVAWAAAGGEGLRGALVGVGLVLGFLLVGQLPVAQVARGRRRLGAALLVLLFVARLLVLLVAFGVFYVADGVDREALGLTVIACALAWTAGTVWSAVHWRPMVVDPEPSTPPQVASEDAPPR
jgi:ATP synthase protein I